MGLGGQYIPSNGDELVYAHIARLTAATGHWLPLASSLGHTRNTKPPLLFWQAMVAGGWGEHWNLVALRLPSVIYTLLDSGCAGLDAAPGGRQAAPGRDCCMLLSGILLHLSLRTPLPDQRTRNLLAQSADVLAAVAAPAHTGQPSSKRRVGGFVPELADAYGLWPGLRAGAGLQVVCIDCPGSSGAVVCPTAQRAHFKLAGAAAGEPEGESEFGSGVGIFALWFVLDPDPLAVWQEFVVAENAGKLSDSQGYWQVALFGGGGSMWRKSWAMCRTPVCWPLWCWAWPGVGMQAGFLGLCRPGASTSAGLQVPGRRAALSWTPDERPRCGSCWSG